VDNMPNTTEEQLFVDIRQETLSIDEAFEFIHHDEAGALNIFTGTTRNHHDGKKVIELYYDCYEEMAVKELKLIAANMFETYDLKKIFLVHRIGLVPVSEASIILGISGAHRKDVFDATAETMNILKERVPIWKRESYEDHSVWKEELFIENKMKAKTEEKPNS